MSQIFSDLTTTLQRALSFVCFKKPSASSDTLGLAALSILIGLSFFIGIGIEIYTAKSQFAFNAYGISCWLAGWALTVVALIAVGTGSNFSNLTRIIADLCMVAMVIYSILGGVLLAAWLLPETIVFEGLMSTAGIAALIWGIAITVFMGRVYWKGERRLPGLKLLSVTLLPVLFIPYQPVVHGTKTDWSRYDVWELWKTVNDEQTGYEDASSDKSDQPPFDFEAAIYRQRDLVERVLSGIKPSDRTDKANVYFLAAAPYASQDVFKHEVMAVKDLFDSRFETSQRSALLINHRDTAVTLPMANETNLEHMLNGMAKSMNVERDVLVLFLTTHGNKGVLSVNFPGFTFNNFTPDSLATMLDNAQIKYRVLIISACHSGSFLPRLKTDNTIILTAAHADKTSFGCSNEREWTYFGDALFNHALRKSFSFVAAFDQANDMISGWETSEKLTPSEPQIFVGREMDTKWAKIAADLRSRASNTMLGALSLRASRHLLAASLSMTKTTVSHAKLDRGIQDTN